MWLTKEYISNWFLVHILSNSYFTALSSLNGEYNGQYFDIPNMLPQDQQQLIDDHILFDRPVSRHFISGGMARDFPDGRGIW